MLKIWEIKVMKQGIYDKEIIKGRNQGRSAIEILNEILWDNVF